MTGHLVSTLARRGVVAYYDHSRADPKPVEVKLPAWGIALLAVTVGAFVLFGSAMEYTIRLLMGHLAMVESPDTAADHVYLPASDDDDTKKGAEAAGLLNVELESSTFASGKPITSSIRRTIRHVKTIGGGKARFRGVGIFVLYILLTNLVSVPLNFVLRIIPGPFSNIFAGIIAHILTARLHCAWTHKVISMPSTKNIKERMISRASWRELVLPTALSILMQDIGLLGIGAIAALCMQAGHKLGEHGSPKWLQLVVMVVPVLISVVAIAICVMMPAYVALVRKEASLLPEEEETIVSMDRTFGGKVTHVGASLSYRDAWRSWTWEARRRLIKLYVKFFFIMTAFTIVVSHVVGLELFLILGDQIKEYAAAARERMSHGQ